MPHPSHINAVAGSLPSPTFEDCYYWLVDAYLMSPPACLISLPCFWNQPEWNGGSHTASRTGLSGALLTPDWPTAAGCSWRWQQSWWGCSSWWVESSGSVYKKEPSSGLDLGPLQCTSPDGEVGLGRVGLSPHPPAGCLPVWGHQSWWELRWGKDCSPLWTSRGTTPSFPLIILVHFHFIPCGRMWSQVSRGPWAKSVVVGASDLSSDGGFRDANPCPQAERALQLQMQQLPIRAMVQRSMIVSHGDPWVQHYCLALSDRPWIWGAKGKVRLWGLGVKGERPGYLMIWWLWGSYPLPRWVCLSRLLVSLCCSKGRVMRRPRRGVQVTFQCSLNNRSICSWLKKAWPSSPAWDPRREEAPQGSPATPSWVSHTCCPHPRMRYLLKLAWAVLLWLHARVAHCSRGAAPIHVDPISTGLSTDATEVGLSTGLVAWESSQWHHSIRAGGWKGTSRKTQVCCMFWKGRKIKVCLGQGSLGWVGKAPQGSQEAPGHRGLKDVGRELTVPMWWRTFFPRVSFVSPISTWHLDSSAGRRVGR